MKAIFDNKPIINSFVMCSFFSYIFPGVGLAAIAVGAISITDSDFFISAAALAEKVRRA